MKAWFNGSRLIIMCYLLLALLMLGFLKIPKWYVNSTEPGSLQEQRVAILTFHSVSKVPAANPVTISAAELDKTFSLLLQRGYHFINLEQFHDFIDGKASVPNKAVLITFDDGYQDNYLVAYPIAKKHQIPAVIFTVTKWFSEFPRPEPHIAHLNIEEAKSLLAEKLWTIASHSHDGHRKINGGNGPGAFYTTQVCQTDYNESEAEYKARLWNDIALSAFTLERVGAGRLDFAFPYDAYNETAKQIVKGLGYRYIYTNESGLNKPGQDPGHIRRIPSAQTARQNLALLEARFGNR